MDPLTSADDELFTAASMAAPAGELAHQLRKLAAGLYMELRLLALQRVDGDVLTLDDGSQVVLQEGDTIRARKVTAGVDMPTGAVIFQPRPLPASGTPSIIEIYRDGVCTRALFFPFEGHKPSLGECGGSVISIAALKGYGQAWLGGGINRRESLATHRYAASGSKPGAEHR
jgi:hypothetical protein